MRHSRGIKNPVVKYIHTLKMIYLKNSEKLLKFKKNSLIYKKKTSFDADFKSILGLLHVLFRADWALLRLPRPS